MHKCRNIDADNREGLFLGYISRILYNISPKKESFDDIKCPGTDKNA